MRDMDHPEHMKYQAGYPGEDSMRAKAERLMRAEIAGTPMTLPASHSTPSHEKMRLYKKGGHVKGHEDKEHHHKKMNHGGHAHKETLQRREDIEAGGHLTNLHLPHEKKLSVQSIKEAEHMKKGGHSHKKHIKHMAHGGHVHEHKEGHRVHKSGGGTVYEHHMLGDHPSTKRPHINYEKEMKGEHCVKHTSGKSHVSHAHKQPYDASMGEYKKHGGQVKHHTKKMAAGGVAKIRHGVATPSGMPIMRKSKKGY